MDSELLVRQFGVLIKLLATRPVIRADRIRLV